MSLKPQSTEADPSGVNRANLSPRERMARGHRRLDQFRRMVSMGRSPSFPFEQWVANDEARTVYFDEGEGRTLVFVHGLGGNITHFEHLARDLVGEYRVVGIDSLGAGATGKPHIRYRVDHLRDHLLGFLDDQGLSRVTLVGHSLGGTVSLAATLRCPERVEALALIGAAGLAPLPLWMRLGAPLVLHPRLLFWALQWTHNFILDNVFVDSAADNSYVRHFRESSLRDAPGYPHLRAFARVSASLCRDVVRRDYSARLPELTAPVLAVWGATDKLVGLPGVEDSLARIPRLQRLIVPGGHLPMIERPKEVIDCLRAFLEDPPA